MADGPGKSEPATFSGASFEGRSFRHAKADAAVGLVVVVNSMGAAQDRKTFTVGTASAARGHKVTGWIEVPPGSDAGLSIPVAVIHGAKPGPVGAGGRVARHRICFHHRAGEADTDVSDYLANATFEARAPVAGMVLYICAVPSMTRGATIANIGVIAR